MDSDLRQLDWIGVPRAPLEASAEEFNLKIESIHLPILGMLKKLNKVTTMLTNTVVHTLRDHFDRLPFAGLTLQVLIDNFQFNSVLDIGSGAGSHAKILADHGKLVTALDYGNSIYYRKKDNYTELIGDFNQIDFDNQFDCAWASHVLEHQ